MAITEEQIMRAAGEPDREGPPPGTGTEQTGRRQLHHHQRVMIEWRAQKACSDTRAVSPGRY